MLELPGINYSPPPAAGEPYYFACASAIAELRQGLGIEQWSVLSYSAGTRAGEAYLQYDASHIHKGIFICPAWVQPPAALTVRFLTWVNHFWPAAITWLLSGQRFRSLIILLAFNGKKHPYVETWMKEIAQQPMHILKATLAELPGGGGSPFLLPPLPVSFIWGRYDIIAPPPRHLGPHDRVISANHAAPMLAAQEVAETVLSFLYS